MLWCDSDVIIYKPFLSELTKQNHDFQLQNNNPTFLRTRTLKTNSGFYLARAVPWVIRALTAVVGHAKKSIATEQMSWNAVLCKNQTYDAETCSYEGSSIHFLPRNKFATGNSSEPFYRKLQDHKPPSDMCGHRSLGVNVGDWVLKACAATDV